MIALISDKDWYSVTDEIQSGIKKSNGTIDEKLAQQKKPVSVSENSVPGTHGIFDAAGNRVGKVFDVFVVHFLG